MRDPHHSDSVPAHHRLLATAALTLLASTACTAEAVFPHMAFRTHADALIFTSSTPPVSGAFILDTGASFRFLDARFISILGAAKGGEELATASSPITSTWYTSPAVALGDWPLPAGKPVFTVPLIRLSQVIGIGIAGVIGMDDLQTAVLTVDYDGDRVVVADALPAGFERARWTELPMTMTTGSSPGIATIQHPPQIQIEIAGQSMAAAIDTGDDSAVELPTALLARLAKEGRFTALATAHSTTAGGDVTESRGLLTGLRCGGVGYPAVETGSTADETPRVGIKFLNRHNLIFDFPGRRLFLQLRAARLGNPDAPNTSGVHLLLDDGAIRIADIDVGSAGERAGLRAGDIVRRIDGQETAALGPCPCRELCAQWAAHPIALVIGRGDGDVVITLGK